MSILRKSSACLASATLIAISCPAAAINFQDWWWNPSQSGMGVSVAQQADTIVAAWFLYGDDGKATFLVLSGVFNGNGVGSDTVAGPLYRTTGMPPGPNFNPASVAATAVGTATLRFTSDTTGVLTYNYDNGAHAGTLDLQRMSFAPLQVDGSYQFLMRRVANCNAAPPAITVDRVQGTVSTSGNTLNLNLTSSSGQPICSFSINYSQAGSIFEGSGTASCEPCPGGGTTTATLTDLRQIDGVLSLGMITKGSNASILFNFDQWGLAGFK